jgi:serine/threonine-protein kinase
MRPEVITLFREVVDRSPADRHDYYQSAQVPDALRAEVESLLQYDASGDSLSGYIASAQRVLLESSSHEPDTARAPGPERIGRFEVTRLLGRGGMGDVYLARDPVLDRPVAIKLIGGGLEDERARRRLVREARTAGRLRHPNIVTVFEVGEHDNGSFIAMEYVPGETLGSIIRRRAPLSLRRRLEMIEGACAGLSHAHRAGVVHLDIKPDNLMLDDAGIVKVLDFGISRVLHDGALFTAHVAGTLRYMSPEQVQGKPLDHRSDVFSLGSSLYELLSYAPAYGGSTREIVNQIALGPVPSLRDACPRLDPRLYDIIGRAMALEPSDRYDELEELRAALADVRAAIDPAHDEAASSVAPAPVFQAGPQGRSGRGKWQRSTRGRTMWRPTGTIAAGMGVAALAVATVFFAWDASDRASEAPDRAAVLSSPAAAAPPEPAATSAPPAVVSQPPVPNDELLRRLARDDRAGVLEWLTTADRGGGPSGRALADAVGETVRATVLRDRSSAAAIPGAPAAENYRRAEEQMALANRLSTAGRPIESLRALWQASDLYRTISASAAPSVSTAEPRLQASEDIASAQRVPETTATAPAVPLAPPPPPPGPSPAAARGADIAAATPPAKPQASQAALDAEAIRETLGRYDAAYEALDLAAVVEVFPSLDGGQVQQLRKTFAEMRSYVVDIRITGIEVVKDAATVTAVVARRMTPRVGAPFPPSEVENVFRLQRAGGDWRIVGVAAR